MTPMRVRAIELRRKTPSIPYSLCYLAEGTDGTLAMIDPGTDLTGNWETLERALAEEGRRMDDVALVICTHLHADHLGLASRVREVSGAPIAIHAAEQQAIAALRGALERYAAELATWQVPDETAASVLASFAGQDAESALEADLLIEEDASLPGAFSGLETIWTPGHTPGHLCLVDRTGRRLFSGDHVLPEIVPGIGLGAPFETNAIASYLASLRRVAVFDGFDALPGHEHRFTGLAERIRTIRARHLRRTAEAAAIQARIPGASVYEIATALTWSRGFANLAGRHLYSALNQTALHLDFASSTAYSDERDADAPR